MKPTDGLRVLSLPFDQETNAVLIASYLSREAAHDDYRAALASGAYLHGAIVVSKDLAGKVSATQADHLVREGAQGLGTLGFLSGLVVPPLVPLTTGFGAMMGGFLGEALHLLTATRVKEQAAAMLPLGCAALILAYPHSSADDVERVVTRAVTKARGEAEGHHAQALRGALAGAEQQMAETGPK